MRRRIIGLVALASALGAYAPPADALFGVGDIVIDPTNLIQNILTAANTLEQINNQVEQLQNEADMIMNQVENLTSLDENTLSDLMRVLEEIDALMREAEDITYEAETSEKRYEERYPESYADLSNQEIVMRAADQWQVSRRAFGHSVQVQSGIVSSIASGRSTLSRLVEASQSAGGNLAVSQAGNQLMALAVEQQMQTQQLMAAHYRMEAIENARRAAIEAQAKIRHERFTARRSAYTRD